MSLKIDRLQLEIIINNDQARKSLRALEEDARQLQKELRKAPQGSEEWDKLNNRLKQNKLQHDKIIETIGIEKLTIKELGQRQKELNAIMRNLDPSSKGYKDLERQLIAVKNRQAELHTGMNKTHFSIQNMAQGINKYFAMASVGIATITGAVFSIKNWISGLTDLDDALANVRKTTGLTIDEVRSLYTEFKYLNTRTPRKELLALAEEAGRLGKSSKKDIMDFVDVANQISVALGDDLQGNTAEATKEVGKLSEIYRIGTKYGTDFRDSMLMMGSAINEVSASSQAEAPFLIDMLKRMGGVANQAGISAQDVIGFASALDQLGQTAEVSGTSMSKIVLNMFTDAADYAAIAKMSVDDFTNLLKEDANEALLEFLSGLNGNNEGLTVMATKLDGLGLDGARSVQVLASLAGNVKLVREQQDLANKSLEAGTSLTNEYNIKNSNMAGNLEKIGRALHSFFVNSSLNKSLEGIVGWFAKWFEIPLQEKLQKEQTQINMLVIEMTNANITAERRNELYKELQSIAPDVVAGIDAENISVEKLTTNLALFNDQMIKKIALQDSEEALQEKRQKYGEVLGERLQKENNLTEYLLTLKNEISKYDEKSAKNINNILLSNEDLITKQEQISKIVSEVSLKEQISFSTNTRAANAVYEINNLKEEEVKLQDDVNKALANYESIYDRIIKKPTATGVTPITGSGDNSASANNAPEEVVSALTKLREELEEINNLAPYGLADLILSEEDAALLDEKLNHVHEAVGAIIQQIHPEDEIKGALNEFFFGPNWQTMELEDKIKAAGDFAINTLSDINNIINNLETQQLMDFEASISKRKQLLNAQLNDGKISYEEYTARTAQLDEDLDKKKRKIAHDQAVREKALSITSAILNTAVAVVKGLAFGPPAGYIFAALNAALGAIQIGIAASQPVPAYAQGNFEDILANDGKKYRARVTNNKHKSGLFSEPTYVPGFGLFGETPKPELVFNPEDTQKLINSPGIVDAINYTIGSRAYANGNSREIIRENNSSMFTDPALIALLNEMKKAYEKPSKAYLVADEDYMRMHEKELSKYNDFQKQVN